MGVQVAGFAEILCRCRAFEGVKPDLVERVLAQSRAALVMRHLSASAEPIVRSGDPLEYLLFIQHGTIVPWQYPYSELSEPFLLGEHEVLLSEDQPTWVGNYSAVVDSVVVEIPVAAVRQMLKEIDGVRVNMNRLVLRRLARFYWTSLSTTGTNESKVAAALVSRLALRGEDAGTDRELDITQKELVRLTAMSRTGVSEGLARLSDDGLIRVEQLRGEKRYITGRLGIPDVTQLKQRAFSDVLDRQVRRLVGHLDDDE